jgi:hypothetical protein
MRVIRQYRIMKLRKSCCIFPTILMSGPILSLYCKKIAILKIRQETYAANKYWNGNSTFAIKLLRVLWTYSSASIFGLEYKSF